MALATLLDELLEGNLLDTGDVARVLGATPRSVNRWATSQATPRKVSEERLLELKAVIDLLRQHLRAEPARLWLRSPNPSLDWQKPLDLVADGQYRRVVATILQLAEGVTS